MPQKLGTIAFITTPVYRERRYEMAKKFICTHMYTLCRHFHVVCTGRTAEFVIDAVTNPPIDAGPWICEDLNAESLTDDLRSAWRETIEANITDNAVTESVPGMICLMHSLVEGGIDAVIHLSDWQDKSAKPDSAVLSRQANVHDVPMASDVTTANACARAWKAAIAQQRFPLFRDRTPREPSPLSGVTSEDTVLAMIAHDQMKLDLCRFAVEHASHIFSQYDYVLATGTTGKWLQRFMKALGRGKEEIERIRCCNSGPWGGDVQIAYAVVKNVCNDVVFFQDPKVPHAHDSDIRLFEQAVVHRDITVRLATNSESAKLLIARGPDHDV